MIELTNEEFNERVAILRRFKQALSKQRDRFRDYLRLLEQRTPSGHLEHDLEFHIEMEQSIVKEIASFERTIEPLETLYRMHDPDSDEIPALRRSLDRTREEVVRRTEYNREILQQQLDAMRGEISTLKTVRDRGSRFAGQHPETIPTLIDVTA